MKFRLLPREKHASREQLSGRRRKAPLSSTLRRKKEPPQKRAFGPFPSNPKQRQSSRVKALREQAEREGWLLRVKSELLNPSGELGDD